MADKSCILAIDQGTTSSRAIAFAADGEAIAVAQEEFRQIYPANGWVEHDPADIWRTPRDVCRRAADAATTKGYKLAAVGVTNQRETTLVWDRATGEPIHNAIVWQDRRTADLCAKLKSDEVERMVADRAGLLLDPYFSATKIAWILDHVEGARRRAEAGDLAFGTVDSYVIWRLTGGAVHATDPTNACRTSLYNIDENRWDPELLRLFNVPEAILPDVRDCDADFGTVSADVLGVSAPIRGVAGDQQAASVGQACFSPGDIKSTYGTGCFVLLNTGAERLHSKNRLLSTIAYRLSGETAYALEGSIFIAGAGVQWLRDGLGVIKSAAETEGLARSLASNNGVYVVPAFTGLGAPHWRPDARGAIFGLTRATGPAELARAMVESVCYQTHDLLAAMAEDGVKPETLRVDGGMVANDWMCEFLAGLLDTPVDRPRIMETTALGAAYLAGLASGVYGGLDDVAKRWRRESRFEPKTPSSDRDRYLAGWRRAVAATIGG
ncbi:MAG: glycerol kinase GlpK [Parvularculaceae bacterium]